MTKTRFAVKGHHLPTVKTNMYLYTDIDIFKTSFFCCRFGDEEEMKIKTLGNFADLIWRSGEAAGAP